MKKLLFLLIVILGFISCKQKKDDKSNPSFFYNETCIIKKIDTVRRTWLVQREIEPKQFAELYVENDPQSDSTFKRDSKGYLVTYNFLIPISHFYNKKLGDKVYFDYILADRFFIIDSFEKSLEENLEY